MSEVDNTIHGKGSNSKILIVSESNEQTIISKEVSPVKKMMTKPDTTNTSQFGSSNIMSANVLSLKQSPSKYKRNKEN